MSDPAIEREIIKLTHEWKEAGRQRDRATLERILADDFLIAGWLPDGKLGDRLTYIEDCMRPVEVEQASYRFDRWKFRTYGDTAIVNCILEIHAVVGGGGWGGVFQMTYIWVKRDGKWQVVTCHTSPVVDAEGKVMK